ncbi:hypothetical protein D3C72_1105700 [compost metagenome]
MEAGAGVDIDLYPAHVGREAGRFGNQRVVAAYFIVRGSKQRVIQCVGAFAGHAAGGVAVEVIIGADRCQPHIATFGRRRVNVVVMAKVGGVLGLTELGESIAFIEGFSLQTETQC